MRIIKQGRLPAKRLFTGTCSYCHCEVECVQSEIVIDQGERNYSKPIYTFKCPTDNCGRIITLNEKPTSVSEMDKAFKAMFSNDPSPTRSSNKDLLKAFEDAFNPKQPTPEEKFKITIPPTLYQRMARIAKGLAKKEHQCGLHRKSELVRRMKKLPGVREKTLNELFDEL